MEQEGSGVVSLLKHSHIHVLLHIIPREPLQRMPQDAEWWSISETTEFVPIVSVYPKPFAVLKENEILHHVLQICLSVAAHFSSFFLFYPVCCASHILHIHTFITFVEIIFFGPCSRQSCHPWSQ